MAIMEQNKTQEAPPESGSKPPSTTPAYFVILHQAQGDEKEERILVANRDASAVAPVVQRGPHESKSATFLSADCTSLGITVSLDNNNMWNEFYRCSTEMVLTKQGRRMFPYCRYWISGMDPYQKYILAMDITPLDTHKYKWNGKWWESGGKADPHVLGRAFIHPESPSTGQYWMHQPVSFYKLKLTNNVMDQEGHIILHSMHRYLPRLHVIPADKATEVIQLNGPDVHTFTFPQTEFFAVTAYQNLQITQLKIDCNPFAKGFREGTVVGRPLREGRPKNLAQEKDSPGSKKLENDNQESTGRLKDSFSMSEQSDAETENESLNAKQEMLSLSSSQTTVLEKLLQKLNKLDSLGDARVVATPSVPAELPKIKIKEEPEDNYDYNKTEYNTGVQVKQEHSDEEITDNFSNSDDDYPILERHFAQFSTKLRSHRKHSVRRPSGVAKAKLLKLDDGKMPTVYLESCSTKKTAKKVLTNNTMRSIKQEEFINDSPSITSFKTEEFTRTDDKRPIKRKIYADYAVPVNVRSTRGRKKKLPSVPAKPKATVTPGSESGAAPVPKRRGRPPKNKGAKVGRPPKKKPPIETPQVPDFKPDLEDVDGVLFVAFSSKEALEVHTVGKPKADIPLAPPDPPVHVELTEEQKKIVNLERQLLVQLKAMRHRQVIHPALQQVGLRLNIVDHSMSIDLRYLGVELPLPFITSDSRWDNCALSSEGLPFVSRTGKTTDFTKIKGWRDKFSTNPGVKSEAGSSETTLKNRSAFCSDELDEYLENEAKLIEDIRGTSQNETFISTVSFQFPTKSASYVRTLDSVLKKQALQASSNSIKMSKPPSPEPVKKRKYTRRGSTSKKKLKTKPTSPAPVVEKPVKSHSPKKPKSPNTIKLTPSQCVKSPTTSQPGETPPLSEHDVTVQPSVLSPGKDSSGSGLHHTPFQSPQFTHRSPGLSKVQMKLLALEETAICQGKPRTYVTEERAEIALSALLTMQGFLKSKPLPKTISKQTLPCNNEFCRLGCICTSLKRAKNKPAHCQQEACMFGCDCVNSKLCFEKDGLSITSTSFKQNAGEDMNSSTEDKHGATTHGTQPAKHSDQTDKDRKSHEEIEKPCISVQGLPGGESNNEGIQTPRRNSGDSAGSCSKRRSLKVVPIWDRGDVENDSEPVSVLEKGEVIEGKIPFQRRQSERVKSSASKSSQLYTPKPASDNAMVVNHQECVDGKGGSFIRSWMGRNFSFQRSTFQESTTGRLTFSTDVWIRESGLFIRRCFNNFVSAGEHTIWILWLLVITRCTDLCPEQGIQQRMPCIFMGSAHPPVGLSSTGTEGIPVILIASQEVVLPDDSDLEDLHHHDSMTCARVRVYKPKSTQEKAKKDHGACAETPGKENSHKPSKYREREKENAGNSEVSEKRHKKTDSSNPNKLFNIISDCSWEQDPKKILNIVSQHVDNKEPQSFRVGGFNIELTSENKGGGASKSSATSHVKITMAPDQNTDQVTTKPSPVKENMESIKPPEQIPSETRAEKDAKSHGGKGLPFYTKVIPAGKLVAQLKNSTLNQSELIQVNGKKFPQAKLLLGQMGALHPANRIAAYITHRLRPSLLYLSKAKKDRAKLNVHNAGQESSTANENVEIASDEVKTAVALPQSETVLPSTPSGVCTDFVMGEGGSQEKESSEVLSPEPTAVELPKMHTQPTPPVLVSTPVSSSTAVTVVSSSVNMISTTPALSSGDVSPTKNQAASLPTPHIDATKLVEKDSSIPVTAALSNDTTNTVILPLGLSPECVSIPPPALIRAPCPPVTSSCVSPSDSPGTNKSLAASVASSLVASANVPTIGLVSSPTGRPTVMLRTVTSPSVSTQRITLTSGLDKRSGTRLLLIPVSNGSAPVRPVQCVQTSPGKKVVLQPIKGPNGVNLFRHPNGQIIQLVPLQQLEAANGQQSQRIVIRSPGSALSIQLPLKTKTDAAIPALATPGSLSIPPAPALQTVSLSKISPVKSGVTSGGLPVLTYSTTTALSSSPQDSAAKPKVILMSGKPAVMIDANNLTNFPFLKSAMIISSSEDNVDRDNGKECKGLSNLETHNTVEKRNGLKESVASAEQEVFTPSIEKIGEVEKKTAIPSRVLVNLNESEKTDISSWTLLQGTNNQDSSNSSQKSCDISTDIEAGHPLHTTTVNPAAESDQNDENPMADSDQDPKNPTAKNDLYLKNAESAQDAENSLAQSGQHLGNSVTESDRDPENPASEIDRDAENQVAESDQDPENPAAKGNCISLEQDRARTEESACSTAQVQTVTDSEGKPQSPLNKSEKKEGEKGRRGHLLLTDFTTMNKQDENLPSDPGYTSSTRESEQNSEDEDESEAEESVDIETVEELSKNYLAQLKAKATTNTSHNDKCTTLVNSSKNQKKGSKVNGDDNLPIVVESVVHRRNHTANERKRRNEMRDLFEELKRALSLHNLPKVSKSYMLKKAIEEIEGLTDAAESLIKKKALMSQKQSRLIKKVSNLSGKPKEVVLKKLEYLYAKQNALEAENKKDLEEDQALKASVNKPPPPLKLENEANESSSSKSTKPIILSRTPVLLSAETQEPVVVTSPNFLMASPGLAAVKEVKVEEGSGISPTHVQADVRPAQMPTDDLSMMPKIVSVTSLAEEASSDLGQEFVHTPTIKEETDTEVHNLLANTAVCDQAEHLPSTSHVLDTTEEHCSSMNITQSSVSSLPENLPLASVSFVNAKASSKSGKGTMNDLSLDNVAEDVRDSELELELRKLSSAIDEAELEPSELSDVMEDHEDSDETLTSLLNEIALLNQQLNNDNSDLGCNFPGTDTPSQGSVDKSAGGDASPFFFGRFKELPEPKENNVSLSPLFLQLDEAEIQGSVKHIEEPGIAFEDVDGKAALTKVEDDLLQPPANVAFLQAIDKPGVASSPNMFWRPMPKLAPLGLKSSNVPSDQRVSGNKSMPSLASAAIRLSSPNHMDHH
ncbi:PREDICTED: MAX gene-associated protein [Nanorana parkeri]|uniref:MAX gene-associated protein n=1 Tax=Nanorana parkeri TaxID=125878 RepID=UPI0008548A71|nr:PREDICTED: MAX gene-associated protein [Nanorana parkeri]